MNAAIFRFFFHFST
ncbi:pheST operon leader peptide PheM [Raoultella planticola]|nr:pheST operon leader peptide PheM [Raoultella planticola]